MKAREIIEARITDLRRIQVPLLVKSCSLLSAVMGDVELDLESQRFLRWMLDLDAWSITCFASLVFEVKAQQRRDILARVAERAKS
jgi:hypothetical protein